MAQHSELEDFDQISHRLRQAPELPFSDVLGSKRVAETLAALGVTFRDRIYTPVTTLWMFLSQVLSADHSCQDAVARLVAWRVARGKSRCSTDTASYCEARKRLPMQLLCRLTRDVAGEMEQRAEQEWLWKGRPVKIVDGCTAMMADTPTNQAAYPQNSEQKPGLGFPIARLVVVFSLATAAVLDAVIAPTVGKKMGETSLFRGLLAFFRTGDVLLGDRLFAGFRDLAECLRHGVDVVARQHSTRRTDFRRGRWLGTLDHVVTLQRPKFHKDRFTREEWERLPLELQIRELRYRITQAGFRPEEITIVTTLLDPLAYSTEELALLYRERWHCELDIRSLKSSLQMGHLRCKTPGMVEKEIWAHLLAYNLIREIAAKAARQHKALPRRLSFNGTVQLMNAFATYLPACPQRCELLWQEMLAAIATIQVGDRPNRFEPRKLKKRKSKYTYLTRPRNQERRRLCA